jgi:hypothetical protein
MNEVDARDLARRIGGQPHHSGGDIWLVLRDRPDGLLLVIGDEGYSIATRADFESGDLDEMGLWVELVGRVAVDRDGNVVDAGDDFDATRDATGRFPAGPGHWTILGA